MLRLNKCNKWRQLSVVISDLISRESFIVILGIKLSNRLFGEPIQPRSLALSLRNLKYLYKSTQILHILWSEQRLLEKLIGEKQ